MGSSTSEDFKAQSEMATTVAKEHKGKILFVYIDVSKADSSRVLDFFNAKAEDAPAMRMTHLGETMIKYKPEVSMERGLLMLSPRLMLMLTTMELTVLAMLVLAMLDMVMLLPTPMEPMPTERGLLMPSPRL